MPRWPVAAWPGTVAGVLDEGVEGHGERVVARAESIIRALDAAEARRGDPADSPVGGGGHMAAGGRWKLGRALVGSLSGRAASLLATPIMIDTLTALFWLACGLILGGGAGLLCDLLRTK